MKYSLAVPFMERIFRLAVVSSQSAVGSGEETTDHCQRTTDTGAAGYVGQITANSLMKREFGKKLIEQFLPTVDLTHVKLQATTPEMILSRRHKDTEEERKDDRRTGERRTLCL